MKTLAQKTHVRYLLAKDRMNERGATAVEYGLLVALIAIAIIGVVYFLGTNLSGKFKEVSDSVSAA